MVFFVLGFYTTRLDTYHVVPYKIMCVFPRWNMVYSMTMDGID